MRRPWRVVYLFAFAVDVAFDWTISTRRSGSGAVPSVFAILPRRLRLALPDTEAGGFGRRLAVNEIAGIADEGPRETFVDKSAVHIDAAGHAPRNDAAVGITIQRLAFGLAPFDKLGKAVRRLGPALP